jgi:hypothetical protein
MKKRYHKIVNAHDAYWFLYDHPKFMLPERNEVTPAEADKLEAEGYLVFRDRGGDPPKCYRLWRHCQKRALDCNLDIHYALVNRPNGRGRVDDDPKKNKYVECWLEFGNLEYGYCSYDFKTKQPYDWDVESTFKQYHDTDLDSGGETFDKALISLAKKVRKKFGDYKDMGREGRCGKPVCGDCKEIGRAFGSKSAGYPEA